MLDRLELAGLRATRVLSVCGLVALMFLAVMTLADGLMRWLANRPIEGVRDVGELAIALAVSTCIPVGLMERGNVSIRFVESFISHKAGRYFDAFASLVVEAVVVTMAWEFTLYASKLAKAGETTWLLKIPVAPFWYGVAALFWCGALVQAIVIMTNCRLCLSVAGPVSPTDTAGR